MKLLAGVVFEFMISKNMLSYAVGMDTVLRCLGLTLYNLRCVHWTLKYVRLICIWSQFLNLALTWKVIYIHSNMHRYLLHSKICKCRLTLWKVTPVQGILVAAQRGVEHLGGCLEYR